ncbi:MAG: tetratricopeptide repeat protein [Candidatus Oleimicrobiaceae bacterium]
MTITKLRQVMAAVFCVVWVTAGISQVAGEAEELTYADKLFQDKLYDLAALQYQRYAERYPTSPKAPQALLQACRALSLSGQYEPAVRTARDALLHYPDNALLDQFLFQQGLAHQALSQLREAALCFERIAAFAPSSTLAPEGLLRAARLYQELGQYGQSEQAAGLLLDRHPTSPLRGEARLILARALSSLNQQDEALAQVDKLIATDPKSAVAVRAQALKAEILDRRGHFTAAEQLLRQVSESTVDSLATAAAAFQLGRILQARGEYAASSSLLDRASQFAPDKRLKTLSCLLKGQSLLHAGSAEEALTAFVLAASTAPGDSLRAEAWLGAGHAALRLQRLESARQYFDAVWTLPVGEGGASQRAIAAATIGAMRSLATSGLLDAAHERASRFAARFPLSPFLDDVVFQDLQAGDDTAECSRQKVHRYLGFLTQFPHSQYADDVALKVAHCYQAMGEYTSAADAYEDYARTFPAAPFADESVYRASLLRSFLVADYRKAASSLALQVVRLASGQDAERVPEDVASLYLESLRDYRTARALYWHLYAQDTSAASSQLLLSLATCYHGLAATSYLSAEQPSFQTLADSAALFYRKVIAGPAGFQQRVLAVGGMLKVIGMAELGAAEAERWLLDLNAALAVTSAQDPLRAQVLVAMAALALQCQSRLDSLVMAARHWADDAARLAGDPELRAHAHWLAAQLSLASGDTTAAVNSLQTIVDRLPRTRKGAQAMLLAAALAEAHKRYPQAEQLYERVLSDFFYAPVADSASARLADLLINKNSYQQAAELLLRQREKQASDLAFPPERHAEPEELKLRLALAYHGMGRSQEAEALLTDFVHQAPENPHTPEALLLLANMAEQRDDSARALTFLRQLGDMNSAPFGSKVLAQLRRAELLFRMGNYRAAAAEDQALLKEVSVDSVRQVAWPRLVISLYRLDDQPRAAAEAEKYLKSYRDDAATRALFAYEEGDFFIRKKDFKKAEKAFQAARDVKNVETAAWGDIGLGKLYLIMNQPDQALNVLAEVPNRYPNTPLAAMAYVNLGDYYFKNGQFENAFLAFQKALAVPRIETPMRALALGYLIDSADRLGMWDRAIALARQYLQEFPNASDTFARKMQIGIFLKNLKDYERAVAHFRELKRAASAEVEPEVQYWIGKCYLEMGRYAEAIAELLKVKYLSPPSKLPWDVTAMYESGLAYMRLGQLDNARRLFERIEREEGSASTFGRVARERIKEIDQQKASQPN